jgi:hypothetical protein
VIVGKEMLVWNVLADTKEAFEESDLPYWVDLLDWNALSPEFRSVSETRGFDVIQNENWHSEVSQK